MQLHSLGFGITALDEPRPTVDVHQAAVVIIVDSGAQDAHMDLLAARVVHVLGVGGDGVNAEMEGKRGLCPSTGQSSSSRGLHVSYCSGQEATLYVTTQDCRWPQVQLKQIFQEMKLSLPIRNTLYFLFYVFIEKHWSKPFKLISPPTV